MNFRRSCPSCHHEHRADSAALHTGDCERCAAELAPTPQHPHYETLCVIKWDRMTQYDQIEQERTQT